MFRALPSFLLPCKGIAPTAPMKDAFDKYGLDQNTIDFIGHALALYRDDK
jgi:RAB protein geranylgeranyltransferase component A